MGQFANGEHDDNMTFLVIPISLFLEYIHHRPRTVISSFINTIADHAQNTSASLSHEQQHTPLPRGPRIFSLFPTVSSGSAEHPLLTVLDFARSVQFDLRAVGNG